jgi:hypothetical protein
MRFFSKFAFICNLCFIVFVIMELLESGNKGKGNVNVAMPLEFLKGTLVVLGFVSLLVSALFCFFIFVSMVAKSLGRPPRWMVIFNFIALLAEIYWFLI